MSKTVLHNMQDRLKGSVKCKYTLTVNLLIIICYNNALPIAYYKVSQLVLCKMLYYRNFLNRTTLMEIMKAMLALIDVMKSIYSNSHT
jgi:hypothetical protein